MSTAAKPRSLPEPGAAAAGGDLVKAEM